MFRELLNYSVTAISTSDSYSLLLLNSPTSIELFVNFWSGSVYHQVCLGSGPRGLLIPKRILSVITAFVSLFEKPPSYVGLIGSPDRLETCLVNSLPGKLRPTAVSGFRPNDLEKSLSLPTSKILERHDFRSILDYLLMKLRTALDREWLQSLPILHKVIISRLNESVLGFISLFSVGFLVCDQSLLYPARSVSHH